LVSGKRGNGPGYMKRALDYRGSGWGVRGSPKEDGAEQVSSRKERGRTALNNTEASEVEKRVASSLVEGRDSKTAAKGLVNREARAIENATRKKWKKRKQSVQGKVRGTRGKKVKPSQEVQKVIYPKRKKGENPLPCIKQLEQQNSVFRVRKGRGGHNIIGVGLIGDWGDSGWTYDSSGPMSVKGGEPPTGMCKKPYGSNYY